MATTVKYPDIRRKSDAEKVQIYDQIHHLYLAGEKVETKAHKEGFPSVTIDCRDIHIVTDILSVEDFLRNHAESFSKV